MMNDVNIAKALRWRKSSCLKAFQQMRGEKRYLLHVGEITEKGISGQLHRGAKLIMPDSIHLRAADSGRILSLKPAERL